ncbi:MAG: DUF2892 domain-containing protein [Nitrospirae bacterium]|nr:DUF2892 domain-containing protein [Candidatus Manganitrophaceae bacterium]
MFQEQSSKINVGKIERWLSAIGGGGLVVYGLKRRSWSGLALALIGGALVHRGVTGRCYGYQALGFNTARDEDTSDRLEGEPTGSETVNESERPKQGVVEVERVLTISQPPEAIYAFWKKLENLPRIFDALETIREESAGRSFWVAGSGNGTQLEWEAQLIEDRPNEALVWGAGEEGSAEVISVRFEGDPAGTRVRLFLKYDPTHSLLGVAFARIFGKVPEQALEKSLNQLKQLVETGGVSEAA